MRKLVEAACAILLLGGLWVTQTAEFSGNSDASSAEEMNDLLDVQYDQDALTRHVFERKAGFAFCFHDAFPSFITQFVAVSDSLYNTWTSRWGTSIPPKRIRGTTAVLPQSVVSLSLATWAQLGSLAGRQKDFEIAIQGEERLAASTVGFSYQYMDSMLAAMQDSLRVHGLPAARTWVMENWRYQPGAEHLWLKHGFNQCYTIGIPDNLLDYQVRGNEGNSAMKTNTDYFVQNMLSGASGNTNSIPFTGYQSHGRIRNRWDIGQRTSWERLTMDADTDTLLMAIDGAVQMGAMFNCAFHNISPDTTQAIDAGLNIHPDSLRKVMRHVDSLMAFGWLESLTLEQLAARGTGYVAGELLPHYGFRCLGEIGSKLKGFDGAADSSAAFVPIGWPLYSSSSKYPSSGSLFVPWDGAAASWKVIRISAQDTVAGMWGANGVNRPAEKSYGLATPKGGSGWTKADSIEARNVIVQQMINTSRSDEFMIPPIPVTGVRSPLIRVSVQMVTEDSTTTADTTTTQNGYIAARFYAYDEVQADVTNNTSTAYAFDALQDTFQGIVFDSPRSSRLRLQNFPALLDTLQADSLYTLNAAAKGWNTAGNFTSKFRYIGTGALPPMIWDDNFNNQNVLDVSFGAFSTAASDTSVISREQPAFNRAMRIVTYTWAVEIIPGITDFIVGQVRLATHSTAFTNRHAATAPTVAILHVGATAN